MISHGFIFRRTQVGRFSYYVLSRSRSSCRQCYYLVKFNFRLWLFSVLSCRVGTPVRPANIGSWCAVDRGAVARIIHLQPDSVLCLT